MNNTEEISSGAEIITQSGIPTTVWVIIAITALVFIFITLTKLFWTSKILSMLWLALGIYYFFTKVPAEPSVYSFGDLLPIILVSTVIMFFALINAMGKAMFGSDESDTYLIMGTLVEVVDDPTKCFFYFSGGSIVLGAMISYASVAWSVWIGIIACGILAITNICDMVRRLAGA